MNEAAHQGKGPFVSDLKAGDHFVGFFIARDLRLEAFRDPGRGHYLRLWLADRTGSIEARLWEEGASAFQQISQPSIVKVEGDVERFRDRLQVRVLRIRPADEGEFELADMLATTSRDPASMMAFIDDAIAAVTDDHLSALLHAFFDDPDFRAAFSVAPAAKRIHHAYRGGLLEHVYEILHLSEPLLELYPELNRDLLVAGILLHDIGKLKEYRWELDLEFTDEGRLLGHVVLGAEWVAQQIEQIDDFPQAQAVELRHMILAHHGRYEWGSPRRPKTMEAIALHHLENLDGQVNRFRAIIETARQQGQPWTTYDRLLGRSLYAGRDDDLPIEENSMTE